MKDDIKEYLTKHGVKFGEENNLDDILPLVDVVYMTRVQKERITLDEYERARGKYVITTKNFDLLKKILKLYTR